MIRETFIGQCCNRDSWCVWGGPLAEVDFSLAPIRFGRVVNEFSIILVVEFVISLAQGTELFIQSHTIWVS